MHICCIYVLNSKQTAIDYGIKDVYKISRLSVPLGISYVSSSLQQNGYTTEIVYCNPFTYKEGIKKYIKKDPQVFAISIVSNPDVLLTKSLIEYLKKHYCNAKILVGGTQVTSDAEQILRNLTKIDAICIGSGEKAVVEYIKQVENGEYGKTDNLWIKTENEVIKCDKSLSIENLDEIPYPDRDGWERWLYRSDTKKTNWEKWLCSSDKYQVVLMSRGCIYNCIFCANKELRQKSYNKYFNERSAKSIVEEIDYLVKKYKVVKGIKLEGENALANTNKFRELCLALKEYNSKLTNKIEFMVSINFTQNLLEKDSDIITLMKEANFTFIRFSLESGSFEIRKILRKPLYNNEQFITFCNMLHNVGIEIMVYVMYCFPFETKETYWQTVNCLRACKPDHFNYTWLRLYDRPVERRARLIEFWHFFIFKFIVYIKYKSLFRTIQLTISVNKIIDKIEEVKSFYFLKHNKDNKYKVMAKQELDKGNYKQAIKYFNKVKIYENDYWVYGDRAIAKMKIGDYKGAIKDLDKVLQLDPKEIYKQKKQECLNLLNT